MFLCGDQMGSRSAALQTLLPLVHVATYDAAAAQRAHQIGGDYTPLYSTYETAGIDVTLAMAQQRLAPHEPLIMNPNLLMGQVELPRHWEQQVTDRQGKPIPVPRDPQGGPMDHVPLTFNVTQNKQLVRIPPHLTEDQDLDPEQAQRIRVTEVAAVAVEPPERQQARRRMQSVDRQQMQRRTQSVERQPVRRTEQQQQRAQPQLKWPVGQAQSPDRQRAEAVKRRVQDMSQRQSPTPSLADRTYDPDEWLASQRPDESWRYHQEY